MRVKKVKLVGLNKGTFKAVDRGWGGNRGDLFESYQKADLIKDMEERWKVIVDAEKMKDGMSEWNAPRVEGWEVKLTP